MFCLFFFTFLSFLAFLRIFDTRRTPFHCTCGHLIKKQFSSVGGTEFQVYIGEYAKPMLRRVVRMHVFSKTV